MCQKGNIVLLLGAILINRIVSFLGYITWSTHFLYISDQQPE